MTLESLSQPGARPGPRRMRWLRGERCRGQTAKMQPLSHAWVWDEPPRCSSGCLPTRGCPQHSHDHPCRGGIQGGDGLGVLGVGGGTCRVWVLPQLCWGQEGTYPVPSPPPPRGFR